MSSAPPSPPRSLLGLRGDPSQHPEPSPGTILHGGQISNETMERLHEFTHSPPPSSIEDIPLLNTYDRSLWRRNAASTQHVLGGDVPLQHMGLLFSPS